MRRRIVCLKKGTVGQSNFDCSHLNVAISNMATLDIVTLKMISWDRVTLDALALDVCIPYTKNGALRLRF